MGTEETAPVCEPCREGRHEECVAAEPQFVERRGPLLDYRLELDDVACSCREGACAERQPAAG